MRFDFKFEGAEYHVRSLMLSEAAAIQKVTGRVYDEWLRGLRDGDVECITALIWVARKRETPDLKFSEVDGDLLTFDPLNDPDDQDADQDAGPPEGKAEPAEPVEPHPDYPVGPPPDQAQPAGISTEAG